MNPGTGDAQLSARKNLLMGIDAMQKTRLDEERSLRALSGNIGPFKVGRQPQHQILSQTRIIGF